MISPLLQNLTGYWDGAFQPVAAAAFEVRSPADERILARLPSLGADHAHLAIIAAARALDVDPPALAHRRAWLEAIAHAHLIHAEELARIITAENGKPAGEALAEVRYAAAFYADAATRLHILKPRQLDTRPRDCTWQIHARPAGVAGLITPFNFPLAMLAKKLSGALAAGCSVVAKPAEKTPLSVIALFHLLHELALPPGTVNLVFGEPAPIGRALCEHPDVRVISFTGSTSVGQWLATTSAPHMKRLSLELGGNAPFIVFADANLDAAADALVANKLRASGQTCVCSNRVLVEAPVLDDFVGRVVRRLDGLAQPLGPLIDARGLDKVQQHLADAVRAGARVLFGGATPVGEPSSAGHFFEPTVIVGATPEMLCWREETFGPLFAMGSFEAESDACALANQTAYGLAAYVFTTDRARLERMARRLRCGHVGLNTAAGPTPEAPFGGMKMSGLGREGGDEGILDFVEWQTTPLG